MEYSLQEAHGLGLLVVNKPGIYRFTKLGEYYISYGIKRRELKSFCCVRG